MQRKGTFGLTTHIVDYPPGPLPPVNTKAALGITLWICAVLPVCNKFRLVGHGPIIYPPRQYKLKKKEELIEVPKKFVR